MEKDPCRISDQDIKKAVEHMKRVGYANTDLKLYDGMRHEILNETGKMDVWNYILDHLAVGTTDNLSK